MISQPLWSFWRHSPLVKTNAFPHCQRYDTFQLTREKFCYEAKIYFQSDNWPCSNHLLLTLFGIFSFSFLHDNKAPRNKTGLWSDLRAVAADCIHLKMYDGLKSIFSHINYQWKRSANRIVTQNFRTNHIRNIIIWTMQTKLHMLLLNPPLIIPLSFITKIWLFRNISNVLLRLRYLPPLDKLQRTFCKVRTPNIIPVEASKTTLHYALVKMKHLLITDPWLQNHWLRKGIWKPSL